MLINQYYRKRSSSYFMRNGEHIEFDREDFHELAYSIAMGPHKFEYAHTSAGPELSYITEEYVLEVTYLDEFKWQRGYAWLMRKTK